jgi:ATP-dependent Clp protease ATP-binding subunit ClpB
MENLKYEAERAEREGDYGKVAEIRYSKLKALEDDIAQQISKLKSQTSDRIVREEVTADDIAEVVSRWTGIPVTRMLQSEREKLLHLEEELHRRVIGQDEAITAVSDAVRRSRAGLQDPKRPIASFIFLGTTGVGKTELAKALAEYLFNDEQMMTRIDMSEYQEKHTVSRLVGAPPGYVGYDEGGQLTEAVRRKPYQVILFDEIEKAHPDVFNILLQVLDDGRLTDNKGRTANFKNTIIIMTSNATREQLRLTMRPEFLNRIDEIITFQQLTQEQIADVVRLQMKKVTDMLEPQGIRLETTDAAIRYLAQEGYDPDFGARPVKRAIQQLVLNDLSRKILADEVNRDKPIIIMTSNATREQLRQVMRPEFLNRIDEIITFQQLTREQIADVVRLQMKRVTDMLEPQGIRLEVTDQAIQYLAQEGYDPDFGARPVKRAIQTLVLNDLSRRILADEVDRTKPIIIDEFGDGLVFRN